MRRPSDDEFAPYYRQYIGLIHESDVLDAMRSQGRTFVEFLRGISEEDAEVLHAPYTWTIKEVVGHLADAELVFAYRGLRFARGDSTPLPGFDENEYVRRADFGSVTLAAQVDRFDAMRRASCLTFSQFPSAAWDAR
ncbi:MAG TPA: DinB family protein, partial [Pirellulaceae bacterium]